jgi:hypothetical protein
VGAEVRVRVWDRCCTGDRGRWWGDGKKKRLVFGLGLRAGERRL